MKQKNAFTLIELLAVIVILAVIALIATPLVLNIIERAEKGAFRDGVYGIMEAAEFQVILDNSKYPITFVYPEDSDRIKFKGTKPTEGYIQVVKEGKIKLALGNGRWCATKNENDSQVTIKNGHCEQIDFNRPIISGYGDLNQEINVNDSYTLPNVTAIDKNGNQLNVTTTVKQGDKIVDSIDTSKEGVYTITYTTEADSEGNQSSVTVTVTVKKQPPAGDKIVENGIRDGGLELIDDTYYYRGSTPKNWVKFANVSGDNEIWRIVSIDQNKTIKIVRNTTLGTQRWNNARDHTWAGSEIETYCNTTYKPTLEQEIGTDKIQTATWNVGAITYVRPSVGGPVLPATIKTEEKQSTWTGDIALLNASDYIYASKNNSCATSAIENSECVNDNWLSNHSTYTLNGRENMLAYLWYTSTSSGLRTIQIGQGYSGNVYPVIHLKTEVKISGEGTEENPYIIQ